MPLEILHTEHERRFAANKFVYPVLSRRSGGISIGVNLNPDKICNFDCIYCQVDRRSESETQFVETEQLLRELDDTLDLVVSGDIYRTEKFSRTPEPLRRLNDIAFSGDGEPTTYRNFDELIAACADVKRRRGLSGVKMVLITNASMFHRPHVQRGLAILDANHGEIWAKLDAGTEAYYQLIDRTSIPFRQILDNITAAAKVRPLVIQSLFMRVGGEPPSAAELEAFCDRLQEIAHGGRESLAETDDGDGKSSSAKDSRPPRVPAKDSRPHQAAERVKLVQVYTIARRPAESYVTPLSDAEVDAIAELVRHRTGLSAEPFYGGAD